MSKNVKEHFSVCVYAYVGIGLRTRLIPMRMHTLLMRSQTPFMLRVCVLHFTWTHDPIYVRIWHPCVRRGGPKYARWHSNPILTVLTHFFNYFLI